jgi:hypothetical protein
MQESRSWEANDDKYIPIILWNPSVSATGTYPEPDESTPPSTPALIYLKFVVLFLEIFVPKICMHVLFHAFCMSPIPHRPNSLWR